MNKNNYHYVTILPHLPKRFERCLFKQISDYFVRIFSKFQFGFRIDHRRQHYLLALLEKWHKSMNQKVLFGELMTDLSKVFDCLPHNLLAAKLFAYSFAYTVLHAYCSWENMRSGVAQSSILGPLLFNIDLCTLFFILNSYDIVSYGDDNIACFTRESI